MSPYEGNERRAESAALLAELKTDVKHIVGDISEIKHKLDNNYVTKNEYASLKWLIQLAIGTGMGAIATAIASVIAAIFIARI